jgi:hypothetical protein
MGNVRGVSMDRGALLRRLVHISAPAFLLYYVLPDPLWEGGPPKEVGLLLVFIVALTFELLRLLLNFKVVGMRSYESEQISAGAWSAIALTFTFLFFPYQYAVPVVIGMAWIDPLIHYLRKWKSKLYPPLPLALYFLITIVSLSILMTPTLLTLIAALVGTVLAIAAESYKTKYVDDDFLMIVVPLVGIALVLSV